MTARNSALEALGLRSNARRAEIDEAYRRLIKLHHPDRPGGDGGRAAEINRAYTLLRREIAPPPPPMRQVPVVMGREVRHKRSGLLATIFIFALLCGSVAVVATMTERNFNRRVAAIRWPALEPQPIGGAGSPLMSFDEPLNSDAIDNAVADAMKFSAAKDFADASEYSRDCQNSLRADPNLAWFDTCAAFDEAMSTLGTAGVNGETGPFSDSELMTRELSASQLLSDDSLDAEARLHQIRSKVEMRLLPLLDSAAGVKP